MHDAEDNSDFEVIQSNEGVVIANVYDRSEYERSQKRKGDKGKAETDNRGITPSAANTKKFENLEHYKKSVISYDGGSTWHHLKAPETDFEG